MDDRQAVAVAHDSGALLIMGAPGTGKTFTLEQRYLRLAAQVEPHRILTLCSTRAYSNDAKRRLAWRIDADALVEVPVYTWHALAYHLVSRYYPLAGLREPPVLLTGPEQWGLVRELLSAERKADWPQWGERLFERGFVDEVADFCLRVGQRLMSDDDLDALAQRRERAFEEVVRFYRTYRSYLREGSRLDYAGLMATAVTLLEENPTLSASLSDRFPHVQVDDAQEMGEGQRRLVTSLRTESFVLAGDPDSGVETFRGAEPDWLYAVQGTVGPHDTIVLSVNHRLGGDLHTRAQQLIRENVSVPEPEHRTTAPAAHETSCVAQLYASIAEEVDAVARHLRRLHLVDGVDWSDMAVLVSRPSVFMAALERALERWEVPYASLSGERALASEPSVAPFLDLVRFVRRMDGWEQILPDLITTPLIGLTYTERRALERKAWQLGRSLEDLLVELPEAQELRRLSEIVESHWSQADECFWEVFSAAAHYRDLVARAKDGGDTQASADVAALVAFSHSLGRFVERRHGQGSIIDYLQEAARADFGGDPWLPPPGTSDGVALLTFHASKGRQWDHVAVCGCLDSWIPKGKRAQGLFDPLAMDVEAAVERQVEAIADDRRLFYVAATRARRQVMFTVSPGPTGRGRPTRFLDELGIAPREFAVSTPAPALTLNELRARLRRSLGSPSTDDAERAAAAIALAALPGTDPSGWYGRWGWTEGAVPLATKGAFATSYSRIGVYENCGLQYLLQSVLGLDPSSSEAMKFGTWVHSLFDAVHKGQIKDRAELRQTYHELFDEKVFPNKVIAAQYRRDGEAMLQRFAESEWRTDNVYAEVGFKIEHEGAVIRGRIDRIDKKGNALCLTDYKTARYAMSRPEAQKSLQLAIYFLAARKAAEYETADDEEVPDLTKLLRDVGGTPKVARLVYPGATWANGDMKVLTMNPEQADEVLETLGQLIADVLDEKFDPSPTANCFFCRMKPLCSLWPEGRELTV